jgi:hypothetical protein
MGDFALADRHVKILLDYARRYTLPLWRELGRMFEALLAVSRGDVVGGLRLLRAGFDELGESLPPSETEVQFNMSAEETAGQRSMIGSHVTLPRESRVHAIEGQ